MLCNLNCAELKAIPRRSLSILTNLLKCVNFSPFLADYVVHRRLSSLLPYKRVSQDLQCLWLSVWTWWSVNITAKRIWLFVRWAFLDFSVFLISLNEDPCNTRAVSSWVRIAQTQEAQLIPQVLKLLHWWVTHDISGLNPARESEFGCIEEVWIRSDWSLYLFELLGPWCNFWGIFMSEVGSAQFPTVLILWDKVSGEHGVANGSSSCTRMPGSDVNLTNFADKTWVYMLLIYETHRRE